MNKVEETPNEFVSIPVEEFKILFELTNRYSKARIMATVPGPIKGLISEEKINELVKHSAKTLFPTSSCIVNSYGNDYQKEVDELMKKKTEESMQNVSDQLQTLARG